MAEKKRQQNTHLRSARQWLSKAEEAFDKDHDVRGELDLFLAQAELRHAQESNRSRRWRFPYTLLQHGLAFGLAVTVAAVGIGGAYWFIHGKDRVASVPPAAQAIPSVPAVKPNLVMPVQASPTQPAQPVSAVTVTSSQVSPPVKSIYTEPADRPIKSNPTERQLSPDEMQKLVRAAGKSLRGDN